MTIAFLSIYIVASLFNITPEDAAIHRFFPSEAYEEAKQIAFCESGVRQFDWLGNVVTSRTGDVGVMQINTYWHEETAIALGLDIYKTSDNVQFARWLYDKYGWKPWYSSEKCWASSLFAYK